jgi:hypothetical protein
MGERDVELGFMYWRVTEMQRSKTEIRECGGAAARCSGAWQKAQT